MRDVLKGFTAGKGVANCLTSKFLVSGSPESVPCLPEDMGWWWLLSSPLPGGPSPIAGRLPGGGAAGCAWHLWDCVPPRLCLQRGSRHLLSIRSFGSAEILIYCCILHPVWKTAQKVSQKPSPPKPSGRKMNLVHTDTVSAYN